MVVTVALRLGLVLALFAALPAQADGAKPENGKIYPASEAAIPNSRLIRFTSAIDKEPYTIQVSIPLWPAPKTGYPVIYVLDGELYFPEAAIAADALADKGAVVVGIGHDTFNDKTVTLRYAGGKPGRPMNGEASIDAFNILRNRDFRWPAKPEHRAPPVVEAVIGPEDGHLDAFLQVIEKEIKPRVEVLVPIDRANQALFGHSAGGLAAVHALFTEPTAFRSFIAASPALWYDGGAVLDGEKQFANDVTKELAAPRILFTAGALEPSNMAIPKEFLATLTQAQRAVVAPYNKMRSTWPSNRLGSRDLAARLKALHGKPGYRVEYQLIADQDHNSSAYVAVIRAMPFAFVEK
jgi:predicted alpha/beta superfamily hydrolase